MRSFVVAGAFVTTALFGVACSGPNPTFTSGPVPTSVPTASHVLPPGAIVTSSASLTFDNIGANFAQTFDASQVNVASYRLAAASDDVTIASVTSTSAGTFVVTPVAAGTTAIVVAGGGGITASVPVVVTTTPVTVSGRAR